MMNHNPLWYAGLIESCGLKKARDLYCWFGDNINDEAAQWMKRLEEWLTRDDVFIRSIDRSRWKQEMLRFKAVYHEAWEKNWGFVRMTDAELDAVGRWLYWIGDPKLISLAEAGDKPVAFSAMLPDVNEALRPLKGRLWPLGWWRLWRGLRRIHTVRYIILGVTPAYRNRGVTERMVVRSGLEILPAGQYDQMEMSWVLEENVSLYKGFERFGTRRY